MRRRLQQSAIVCIGVLLAGIAYGGDQEEAAVAAADKWLALVDTGDYETSWKRAASLFRNAVSPEVWAASASAGRLPFGKLVSRKLVSANSMTTLPGAPDGKYVVIQYSAVYEHKQAAIETVTPMFDDGEWKVSGYYIK
jgi:hypothetical protein